MAESYYICYFKGAIINRGDTGLVFDFSLERISGNGYAARQPGNKYRSQFIVFF